jgi:cell division septation protein DedD
MSRSYYVIELSARWLTVLLVGLAVLMVLAFGLGYGAARSVGGEHPAAFSGEPTATPLVETEVIADPTVPAQPPSPTRPAATPTPRPAPPTVAPPKVTPTNPPATATPKPKPTEKAAGGFWVQILASSNQTSIDDASSRLIGLGFDREHQKVVRTEVAGGNELIKLRVGPFPDRPSADRVLQRMRTADFPDAWVVVP